MTSVDILAPLINRLAAGGARISAQGLRGSSRAYVDNYLLSGNICYDAGPFLVGGGRPSHNIRVLDNYLYNINMQIGYAAGATMDHQALPVTRKIEFKSFPSRHECNAKCLNGKHNGACECQCGGKNHGAGMFSRLLEVA